MKKISLAISLVICLLALNFANAQTDFIIPANAYTLSSSEGTFTDIAGNPGTVKFGENLPANTPLRNGFFINDATTPFVTHAADRTKTDPGFALGFDFNFCGKTMKYFTVCASGGLHFGAQAAITQTQSSVWYSQDQDFQNLVTVATWDATNAQDAVLSIAGEAPVMYLIEGEAGQKVLTVQYHYAISGDEWTYQLKIHEASGNIEFIAGDLNTQNINQSPYALAFGLVENGNRTIADDPFGATNLNLYFSGEAYHKAAFGNKTESGDWDPSTVYTPSTTTPINKLNISSDSKPQNGYTLIFNTPTDCADKADKFDDEWYGFGMTKVSKTSFAGRITFDKTKLTATEMKEAGSVLAVLSTSETPDYTLDNGTWVRSGKTLSANSRVLLNAKPNYYTSEGNISGSNPYLDLSASGLTEATTYYIHIYAMDYRCTGAPVYSDLCRTFSFTTSIDLPQILSAGLPTTSSVPLTVQSAGDGYGVILLKSPNTNPLKLSGKPNVGDQFGEAEVLTVINGANRTVFDAPFVAGEGAYILAYSIKNPDAETPVYGQDFLNLPVRAAYDILPTFRFENETFSYPNPNEYGRLPFGWFRETEFPDGLQSNAFRLSHIDYEYNCLASSYPATGTFWADVITPAFTIPAGKNKISVTFYLTYAENTTTQGTTVHKPTANDEVRIEYSINGDTWQTALETNGLDDNFPQLNAQGQYPLNTMIADLTPNSIVRLRYSYRSPSAENSVHNRIRMVEIIEGKDCDQPSNFHLIDSLTTNGQLTFRWMDNNFPVSPTFVLAYQAENETNWQYKRVATGVNHEFGKPIEGSLSGLKTGTMYKAKIAALCGTRDSSFYTEPLTVRTAYGLPYKESMEKIGNGATAQTPFDRGLKTYSGAIGRQLIETTEAQTDWNQIKTSDPFNRANAISVYDRITNAWLMMPAAYIRKTGDLIPKSLSFTLSSFNDDKTKGVVPNYNDTKLHILVSGNGSFTESNIVKTLDADSLAVNEHVFSIDMTEWEGFVQVAFVFECPTGALSPSDENNNAEEKPDPWYLEIQNFLIKYDVDVCFPVENISHSPGVNEVPLEWDASASAVEYGIFWKRYNDAGYSDENAAYTKETHYTITGLQDDTRYTAIVVAYCNENRTLASEPTEDIFYTLLGCHTPGDFHVENITTTGADFVSTSDQPDFLSYRIIYITPDNEGKSFTLRQKNDLLRVRDSLTKSTAYTATTQAVCEDIKSAMSEAIHFTTLDDQKPGDTTTHDTTAVETIAQLNGLFCVRTWDGQIAIHNLNGLLIRNVSIHNLNGTKLADFRVDSRDDLLLPIDARRMLIFVRLQTERGTVVYKVYLP